MLEIYSSLNRAARGLVEKIRTTTHSQNLDLNHDTLTDVILLYGTTFIFGVMMVLATLQVFVRTVLRPLGFNYSFVWSQILAVQLFIIALYFGAAISSRNREHIQITFLQQAIRGRSVSSYIALRTVTFIAGIIFVSVGMVSFTFKAINQWNLVLQVIPSIKLGYIYSILALAFIAMLIYEIIEYYKEVWINNG